jgi:aspartyl-tRNA synthetase
LKPEIGNAVVIRGWVFRLRVLAQTTFIIVKDCTGEARVLLTRLGDGIHRRPGGCH